MAINPFISKNSVGIGTTNISVSTTQLAVFGGNVQIGTASRGIVFPDGTFMNTAAVGGGSAVGGTGAIQYADGTAFAGDNTKLYFDGTNKIGIGTNDVSAAGFHAKTALPALFDTTSGTDRQLRVGNSAATAATLGYDPSAVTGYLRADPIGTNMITWSSAGVGINGITAPLNTLDVAGGTVIGSGLAYAGSATAPTDGLLVQGAVGVGTVTAGTNVKLGVFGGNLQIGTDSRGIVFPDGSFQNVAATSTNFGTFAYTGNGTTTIFSTSPITATSKDNTMVYVNGVYQPKSTYSWTGTDITLDAAPSNGASIEIIAVQAVVTPIAIGGSTTQVLFNDAGNVGGDANFTFNKTTDVLTIDGLTDLKTYTERLASPSISSNTLTLDLSSAGIFAVSLDANITTLTITNVPSTASRTTGFTLILTADGTARTVAWPLSFRWPDGTAPTITDANGKRDVFSFFTTDNGTSWNAFTTGQNL